MDSAVVDVHQRQQLVVFPSVANVKLKRHFLLALGITLVEKLLLLLFSH